MKKIIIAGACLLVAGCVGPLVPVANLDEQAAQDLNRSIAVYPASMTPASARIIGPVTATSCKNKLWDKAASRQDAITQLRYYARQQGGNAVGNLICQKPNGTDLATNCWESITCTGTALLK